MRESRPDVAFKLVIVGDGLSVHDWKLQLKRSKAQTSSLPAR